MIKSAAKRFTGNIIMKRRKALLFLVIAFLLMQGLSMFRFGIYHGIDTEAYLENTSRLLSGSFPEGRDLFYLSYLLVLSPFVLSGISTDWVIAFQIIIAGFSVLSLYRISLTLFGDYVSAFFASLLYVTYYEFFQWNLILYTDSLFVSFTIIAYDLYLHRFPRKPVLPAVALLFVAFLRPVGVLFIISLIFDYGNRLVKNTITRTTKWILILSIIAVSFIVLDIYLSPFYASIVESYRMGEIIYPAITLGIEAPAELLKTNNSIGGFIGWTDFIITNPTYFFKLFVIKAFLFLFHVKPYYSLYHNAFVFTFLLVIYIASVRGAMKVGRNGSIFSLFFIILQFLMVSLTSENWDGRFLLPFLPWIFLYAGVGFKEWAVSISNHFKMSKLSILILPLFFYSCKSHDVKPQLVSQFVLFEKDSTEKGCYRIPALTNLGDGVILAAVDKRSGHCGDLKFHRDIDIVGRKSVDNGKTWSEEFNLTELPEGKSASDVSFILDKVNSNVFMAYNFMNHDSLPDEFRFIIQSSADKGKQWQNKVDITHELFESHDPGDFRFITSGHGTQSCDGILLHTITEVGRGAFVFGSRDYGKSWEILSPLLPQADESKIEVLKDGTWLVNSRVQGQGFRDQHVSIDQGNSWEQQKRYDQIDPSCNGSLVRFDYEISEIPYSVLLLSHLNDSLERKNLVLEVSKDGGAIWKSYILVPGSVAYSSMVQVDKNHLGILFEQEDYSKVVFQLWDISSLLTVH